MKRLLISTTALSIALSGINPAMLVAQEGKAPVVCAEGSGADCAPQGKKKKQQQADEAGQGQKKKQQNAEGGGQKKKQQQAEEGGQQPKKKQQQAEDGQQQPKKKQQQAAEDGQPKKKQQQQAEDGQQQPKKKQQQAAEDGQPKKKPQAEAPQIPSGLPAGSGGSENSGPAGQQQAEGNAPRKQQQAEGKPQQKKQQQQAEDAPEIPSRLPAGSGGSEQPGILPVLEPSEGAPRPKKEAVQALDTILTEDAPGPKGNRQGNKGQQGDGKPRKPAAAEIDLTAAPAGDAQVTRRKVERDDFRRSGEEFTTRAGSEDRDARRKDRDGKEAKKKDGGLSDLEKAGLVVLGALAVGALLNNGNKVVSNTGDRVVMDRGDGTYYLLKDDDTLLRQPGSDVQTETFADGSTRTTVWREDGTRIVTIRDATGRTLRRALVYPDGTQTLLIDDLSDQVQPVDLATLPRPRPGGLVVSTSDSDADLRAALYSSQAQEAGRSFSLQQIRDYAEVRALAPTIDVENITFETGSAAILPTEAEKLSELGAFMQRRIEQDRSEMFLIEGHTDAVGSAVSNLALSDRRAESLALALTEYFGVPPENMVVQGYGEGELRIDTDGDEPRNRRAVVRMISPLMNQIASAE